MQNATDCILQAPQEVGLLDGLTSGFPSTLGDLCALAESLSGVSHVLLGRVAVIRSGCDIVSMVVGGDLWRKNRSAGSQFLLVAFSLFFVQSYTEVRSAPA